MNCKGQPFLLVCVAFMQVAFFCNGQALDRFKRQDDSSKKLRVVTILDSPYVMQNSDGSYSGYMVDLMKKVAELLGVKYEFYLSPDGKYGGRQSDGTWSGMIGELTRNEADIAAAALTITSIRERVVDFTKPFMNSGITVLSKKPKSLSPSSTRIFSWMFEPFQDLVWLLIVIVSGLVWLLIYLLRFKIRKPTYENENESKIRQECTNCKKAFLKLIGIKDESEPVSVILLYASWRFFAFFTLVLYVFGLWAYMPSSVTRVPIQDFEDLVESNIPAGYISGGSTETFFRVSNIPLYERFFARVNADQPSPLVGSTAEGVERVLKGNYALLGESSTFEYLTSRNCELTTIGHHLNAIGYGLATPIGSDLRDRISLVILELIENGEMSKLEKKWFYEKGMCPKIQKASSSSTTVPGFRYSSTFASHLFYAYAGLTVLLCMLAVVVRCIEIVCSKRQNKSMGQTREKDKDANKA